MLKNIIVSSLRFLKRNRSYALLNLVGLSIGITCSIFIFSWVIDELSYDKCYHNADNIFRLVYSEDLKSGTFRSAATPAPYAPAFKEILPEINDYFRVKPYLRGKSISYNNKKFIEKKLLYADPSILKILNFNFISGNLQSLNDVNSVVITESTARKYFKNEDPHGKIILLDNEIPLKVTGVINDLSQHSHLQFDFLLNFDILKKQNWKMGWYNRNYFTYFLLEENTNLSELNDKLCINLAKFMNEKHNLNITSELLPNLYLQPIRDIHLKSNFDIDLYGQSHNNIQYIYFMSLIGLLILIICIINYTNLSMAYYTGRNLETRIRKILGASQSQLMIQFYIESFIMSVVAYVIGVLLFKILIPEFNYFVGKNISYQFFDWRIFTSAVFTILFTGILAGTYPAIYVSSQSCLTSSKRSKKHNSTDFRKFLVIIQFSLGILLIIAAVTIKRQMNFVKNKNLGLDRTNIIYIPTMGKISDKFQLFKQELEKSTDILNVTYASALPTKTVHSTEAWWGDGHNKIVVNQEKIEHGYIQTMGIQLKEGRQFEVSSQVDSSNYIINESAAKLMGLENPLGEKFELSDKKGRIIGVMYDFNFESLHNEVDPLVYHIGNRAGPYILIRLKGKNLQSEIETVRKAYEDINPAYAFEYANLENDYDRLYAVELKTEKLFTIFSIIAISLAFLGFFGLTSFLTRQRTKEIAIRQVHGASANQIAKLLILDFSQWIVAANAIAMLAAYFLMRNWLNNFAYRTNLDYRDFLFTLILSFVVASVAQLLQMNQVIRKNPIESLKYE